MRFIMDYLRLNQQLVRKTYIFPKIRETIQKLEGLQYVIALDLKIWYYVIRISSASKDMTTTVTQYRKLIYNRLPTRM